MAGKNIGEWSEIYIFFKLIYDKKIYVADKDMKKIKDAFLNIISIIREETKGMVYKYHTGEEVKITCNDELLPISIKNEEFYKYKNKVIQTFIRWKTRYRKQCVSYSSNCFPNFWEK